MGLRLAAEAQAYLRTIPPEPRRRIREAVARLAEDPYADELDIRPVRSLGGGRLYRCRVGSFRIVFAVVPEGARVLRVFHRRDGYGWLERL